MFAKSPRGLRPTLGPIRNPYREIVSIAYGFFSPLEGVMTWNEVESVLREETPQRMSFPLPQFRRRWRLCGSWGASFGAGREAGGFAFRCGYAVTCGRPYGGVLLTAAAGVFLFVVGAAGFLLGAGGGCRLGGVVV